MASPAFSDLNLAMVIRSPRARIEGPSEKRSKPTPGPDEIVVQNYAVAVNPVDWKIQDYNIAVTRYPTVLGSDVCGTVYTIGSAVKDFKVGDRVTGFAAVIGNSNPDHGAFQQYTILKDIVATKIPNFMTFEEGSVFPMAAATAAVGIFINLGISRPTPSTPSPANGHALLVWSGSSSVGTMVVQMGKVLGFTVFATASPANHEYVKGLGATEVFDYRDPEVVSKLVNAAKSKDMKITYAFDAIAEGNTTDQTAAVLIASADGQPTKLARVLPPESGKHFEGVAVSSVIAYNLGTEYAELGKWFFNEWLAEALESKTIVPSPKIEVFGELYQVQKAIDKCKEGVSAKKLVLQVDTRLPATGWDL